MFYTLLCTILAQQLIQPESSGGRNVFDLRSVSPLRYGSLGDVIMNVIRVINIYIAPPLFVLMILIGAFQILTSAGNEQKMKTGWKTIGWSIAAYIILLCAWGVIYIIYELLGGGGVPPTNYPINL